MKELPIVLPVEPGKSLPTYRVEEELGIQSRLDWLAETQRLTPYTGHEQDLDRLEACYQELLHGKGSVVLVGGEAGIGKSRLLWELKRKLDSRCTPSRDFGDHRPVLWLESHCLPHYQNTNLYPVIGHMEQLIGIQPEDDLDVRREKLKAMLAWYGMERPATLWLLSTLLSLQAETSAQQTVTAVQREQMRQACVELIRKRAAEQPIVLLIEDLHWSDPSTVDWIERSFSALSASPCLVLLTSRPTFTAVWLTQPESQDRILQLNLTPLAQEQVEDMISGLVGNAPMGEDLYRHILEHTDGIPLYIEELAKALLEHPNRRSRTGKGLTGVPGIPATLQDSLVARLDALGTARETAQWAAVLGREFDLPVLQVCVPYEEVRLQDDMARLIQAELVVPMDASRQAAGQVSTLKQPGRKRASRAPVRYSFKHALLQEAIYDSLLRRTRREYHRRIADKLREQFPEMSQSQPEVLAQHYANADMPAQAADLWLLAGERSTAQGATLEALNFFNRAMEVLDVPDYERRWRGLAGREHVFDLRGDREAQMKDIAALLDLAESLDDDLRRAEAAYRHMQHALRLNQFSLMLGAAETAQAAARRTGDKSLVLRALVGKVHALTSLGEQRAAQPLVEEILPVLPGIADPVIQANVMGELALYYFSVGDLSFALQLMHQSAQAARRAGDRRRESRTDANIGFVYALLGLYTQARTVLEEGMALAEAIGERDLVSTHEDNLSYIYWCMGDREQAIALAEQALQRFKNGVYRPQGEAACLAQFGFYLAENGEWAPAVMYLAEAIRILADLGNKQKVMEQQALQACCLLALGRQGEARQLADEAWSYLREHGPVGVDFPARMYSNIADVFTGIESPPASPRGVIEAGYRDLMQSAAKISDEEWRRSFLENVAENRKLIERWEKMNSRG